MAKAKGFTAFLGKIDKLKEQKADLREIFKALLYVILGLLTGIVTLTYQIFIGKIPVYMVILGGIGLIIIFLIGLYAILLWQKMQTINEEMEDVD